ncbi:mitochondrial carrier domain-containing protein [Biscogniauxia sp. FL1348]|nr:mitochondrial carrier domain-containing protein [Biscogniauxia sp. FL1348]
MAAVPREKSADEVVTAKSSTTKSSKKNYKGFVAGVFSGVAKLAVGHPFDTIKVRLQTTEPSRFRGPLQCVAQTLRHEGVRGLYKGATPPLVGWMFMDSLMLGSLTIYRRLLSEKLFPHLLRTPPLSPSPSSSSSHATTPSPPVHPLPSWGHGLAGVLAGLTVSFVAAPVEHVKARLQIQYGARGEARLYAGPVDCARRVYGAHGLRGLYKGLGATLLFRSFFFCWWGSYDALSRLLRERRPGLGPAAVNFWAGGLSAQVFWVTSYPSDVVKQRIMTDPLGGPLGDGTPKYGSWWQAARAVYAEGGARGYWRGFLPCFLRAFPANAMALVAFEGIMRALP